MKKPIILRGFLGEATRAELVRLANRRSLKWEDGRRASGYKKCRLDDFSLFLGQKLVVPKPFVALVECLWQRALAVLEAEDNHGTDLFLLRYPPGSFIATHRDGDPEDSTYNMVRLNALIEPAEAGGQLLIRGYPIELNPGDAVLFRPDHWKHAVTKIERGRRLVFTAGAFV